MNVKFLKLILVVGLTTITIVLLMMPWSNKAQTTPGTDLPPIETHHEFATAFWTAVRVAKSMPMWTLREVQFKEGIILAEARTPTMNFIDDVRIQLSDVTPVKIVVTSSSRVGLSDFGVNRRRIRAYLSALSKHLP